MRFLNSRNRGIGKVMWGTDYPLILHNESLEQIDQLDLKPEALQALLHDTAAKVFKHHGRRPRPARGDDRRHAVTRQQRRQRPAARRRVEDRLRLVTLEPAREAQRARRRSVTASSPAAVDELAARDDVAVVVLTGAGRAFCAGADLRRFTDEIDVERPACGPRDTCASSAASSASWVDAREADDRSRQRPRHSAVAATSR